jgi:hypothetical protein
MPSSRRYIHPHACACLPRESLLPSITHMHAHTYCAAPPSSGFPTARPCISVSRRLRSSSSPPSAGARSATRSARLGPQTPMRCPAEMGLTCAGRTRCHTPLSHRTTWPNSSSQSPNVAVLMSSLSVLYPPALATALPFCCAHIIYVPTLYLYVNAYHVSVVLCRCGFELFQKPKGRWSNAGFPHDSPYGDDLVERAPICGQFRNAVTVPARGSGIVQFCRPS